MTHVGLALLRRAMRTFFRSLNDTLILDPLAGDQTQALLDATPDGSTRLLMELFPEKGWIRSPCTKMKVTSPVGIMDKTKRWAIRRI